MRFQPPYYQCIFSILFINFLISRSNKTSMRAIKDNTKRTGKRFKDMETRMLASESARNEDFEQLKTKTSILESTMNKSVGSLEIVGMEKKIDRFGHFLAPRPSRKPSTTDP